MNSLQDFQFSNFDEISQMVYRLAFALTKAKVDADDVYQEVFLSYLKKPPSFESMDHQKAWFIVVTKNACKKLWRSPLYRFKVDELAEQQVVHSETEDYSLLYEVLKGLSLADRTLIHLHYFEGYSLQEVSSILQINYATVRKQMSRARQKLKVIYERDEALYEEL